MSEFRDKGLRFFDLDNYRIVECPKCSKPVDLFGSRFSCKNCGFIKDYNGFSDLENYLKINCCNNTLWAINLQHLDFIEDYVSAKIRTRTPNINKSLASRLPQWVKNYKNRDQILKCIKKLRNNLQEEGYKRRVVE